MIKELEKRINDVIAELQPAPDKLEHEYYLLAEMSYRTMGCYRDDQSVMTDQEFLKKFAEDFMSLEAWIELQRSRRLNPFSGSGAPQPEEGMKGKGSKDHRDFSDR